MRWEPTMFGGATPYVIAVVMIAFCALSAFALITAANHFDDDRADTSPKRRRREGGYNHPAPR